MQKYKINQMLNTVKLAEYYAGGPYKYTCSCLLDTDGVLETWIVALLAFHTPTFHPLVLP